MTAARPAGPWGMMAEFETPGELVEAARAVVGAGYRRFDCHCPFPLHELDEAMAIRPTILPWLVFGAGATGFVVAVILQAWTNGIAYPFLISGKPLFSWPANVPVAFELTILFSAITAFVGMLLLNWLPAFYHPAFKSERFRRVTNDRFFLVIEAADAAFDPAGTRALLESLGPARVEELEE